MAKGGQMQIKSRADGQAPQVWHVLVAAAVALLDLPPQLLPLLLLPLLQQLQLRRAR